MKDVRLLVFVTQFGISVASPLVVFILLAVWLHKSCGWGVWVLWAGVILGLYSAVEGLRATLKAMSRMSRGKREEKPPVAFNDHA